ncbi:MAG: ABC transporter ATP-binding protein [Candidatus Staskawiczbacteria bacterium]|nr:ABC transporter ATP-binding protein [Candidatus Staskawiczbacteria bacterium]
MPKNKLEKNIVFPEVKLKDVLRAFWNGIKPKKWLFFTLVASIILGNIFSILTPIFYKQFFDIISISGSKADVAGSLINIIIYIAILNGFFWTFYRIATWSNNNFQPSVIANLKQQSYDHLMQHSYSFFANSFAGSLVQKVNRFARAFETLCDRLVWDVLPLIVRVISVLVIVFFINKWITLIIFIWVAIFLSFNIIFSKWKIKYDIKVAEIDSKTTGYLADTITNQNTIQLFNGFNFESRGYKKVTNEQAKTTNFAWNLDSIMEAAQGFLSFAIQFILFYFAIKYWQQGLVTIGVFVLLEFYIISLIDQLWGFTRVVRFAYQSYADAKEMVEIVMLPHEIKDRANAQELTVSKGEIDFQDLTFSFNDTRKVLENINLIIKPGEKVALIGPSGAGKTTFVRLLLRLYSATSGKILIDGQDIAGFSQESLRSNISMVPQDPILFHRTLAENIAYGARDASIEKIKKAASLAHCDEFIKELPYGLETYVGERGIKLSGGERQRVAIARAILKNAPILVLDEATSSLYSNSEMLIQDALNNLMADKTVIVIAHRLSTIQKMDRIIVVDNGKIIEQGSHDELLEKDSSLYKKLWELQAGGFLKSEKDEEPEEVADEDDEEGWDEGGTKGTMVNF